jgi:hypothetical protein
VLRAGWLLGLLALSAPALASATEVQFTPFPQVNRVVGYSISLAQLTNHGRPDVVACKFSGLLVYPDLGDGTFGTPTKSPLPGECTETAVGDLNGDGTPDVVASTEFPNRLLVFTGRHDGTLSDPDQYPLAAESLIATGDFNGDGNADVAAADLDGNQLTIFRGDGSGGLASGSSISIPSHPRDLAVADFNGDSVDDLAVISWSSRSLKIILGSKRGRPTALATTTLGHRPWSVAAGNLVGGPATDLAIGAEGWSGISLLKGDSAGHFAEAQILPIEGRTEDIGLADLNGDGLLDVVAPNA